MFWLYVVVIAAGLAVAAALARGLGGSLEPVGDGALRLSLPLAG